MRKLFLILIMVISTNFIFSEEISKCGTPLKKQMREKKLKRFLKNTLSLPSEYNLEKFYETDHFKLWYTTSGNNAVPATDRNSNSIPDYIENAAKYCEESYSHMVNTLKYLPPPTTSKYPKIYVYFINMSYFGWTDYGEYPDDTSGENTLIAIHKDMSFAPNNDDPEGKIKGALKVTIAHELFHAVKASYDWEEEVWWDEATSVWMEDEVYDEVNDYLRYLKSWFADPSVPLDKKNSWHEYGSVIFAKYLSENYGKDIVKEIWEKCKAIPKQNAKYAIDEELKERGSSFSNCFKYFTVANYLKNYKEGSRYPDIALKVNSTTPYINSSNNSIYHLSSNYIAVPAILKDNRYYLPVRFNIQNSENFAIMAIGINSENKNPLGEIPSNQKYKIENFEKIVLIPNNFSFSNRYSYSYITGFGVSTKITKEPAELYPDYSNGVITLSWKPAEGDVKNYNIYRSFYEDKNYILVGKSDTNSYTDTIKAKTAGTVYYYYFVTAEDSDGYESLPSEKKWVGIETEFRIEKCYNYPNPAKDKINFVCEFIGPPVSSGTIEIYNIKGRKIKEIYSTFTSLASNLEPEKFYFYKSQDISVNDLANGVYIYRIIFDTYAGRVFKTGKLVILK